MFRLLLVIFACLCFYGCGQEAPKSKQVPWANMNDRVQKKVGFYEFRDALIAHGLCDTCAYNSALFMTYSPDTECAKISNRVINNDPGEKSRLLFNYSGVCGNYRDTYERNRDWRIESEESHRKWQLEEQERLYKKQKDKQEINDILDAYGKADRAIRSGHSTQYVPVPVYIFVK